MNIQALSAPLAPGEAYLVFSEENRRYLTSFPATDGWLLITNTERILFADSRYIEAARAQAKGCTEVALFKTVNTDLPAAAKKLGIKKIFIEADRMTVSVLEKLKAAFGGVIFDSGSTLTDKINELRAVKAEDEINQIIAAQRIAEKAFNHILEFMREGVTEREVALELDYYMLRNGAEALSFETIAVSGANSSMPHGVPGSKKLCRGDFVTLDYGAVVNGYHSDMTRTVAIGEVSEKQKNVYDIVLSAQRAAEKAAAPGVICSAVDKAARDIIAGAGYGEFFGHSTGHGVGIEIHEEPSVAPRNTAEALKPGNVISNEPGIYLPGEFGVRTEDMLLITDSGCRNLTLAPHGLITLNR